MEVHIHPFSLHSTVKNETLSTYLHTSPEFHMKKLLSEGLEKIFTISYCFRDEPDSPIHRSQFLMLEWYRANVFYTKIMDDCENLIKFCHTHLKDNGAPINLDVPNIKFERYTIQELFLEYLNIDILNFLERDELLKLIQKDFKDIPVPSNNENLSWDDCYFLLFLNKIENQLINRPYMLLYEYPHHLNALSTIKESDRRVCERFEIYLNGIEICNCFNELINIEEQRKRFEKQALEKQELYNYALPTPHILYQALEKGIPKSSGIALGIERLLKALVKIENPFFV